MRGCARAVLTAKILCKKMLYKRGAGKAERKFMSEMSEKQSAAHGVTRPTLSHPMGEEKGPALRLAPMAVKAREEMTVRTRQTGCPRRMLRIGGGWMVCRHNPCRWRPNTFRQRRARAGFMAASLRCIRFIIVV